MTIDGRKIANEIKKELKEEIVKHSADVCLAVILCNDRLDSEKYVSMKQKGANEIGIKFRLIKNPLISEEELENLIRNLNDDDTVNGIIVQLPLPEYINYQKVLSLISPEKDIDGFLPENIGKLCLAGYEPDFIPCTAKGVIKLIESTGVNIQGKDVVIVGCGNFVGLPIAMYLLKRNATVTICHVHTENIREKVKRGEILVSATGCGHLIKGEWIKKDAIVIDVGISRSNTNSRKLIGDVCFDSAKEHASWITPVPGGVGPMTVVMLLENTFLAWRKQKMLRDSKG